MNKKIITIAMFGVFLFSDAASAQTNDLSSAGITPGNPIFFLDRFFEGIGTFFTFGEANKARRYLALAEERLAETKVLAELQDGDNTTVAVELYEEQLAKAKERAGRAREIDLEAKVTDAKTRHLSIFDQVLERVPEQARDRVQAAKERTMTGQLETLRSIAEREPWRAAEIFATATEGRLRAIQTQAERGVDDKKEVSEVEKALHEYEKYALFGKEIAQIVQGLDADETEVRALIERATSQNLQVLQNVRAKVPPQAQDGINRAIQNAERSKQFLPTNVPSRVDPGVDEQRDGARQGAPGAGPGPEGVGREYRGGMEVENEGARQQQSGMPGEIPDGRL